jgi:hypothetical protein
VGGRHRNGRSWTDPLAPSSLFASAELPLSSEDGYPWALQRWDSRARAWLWASVGMVPLRRRPSDLRQHARVLKIRVACRYVWVRHWSPDRDDTTRGWRACLDTKKTIGPVRP